jgi:hypothetical protein
VNELDAKASTAGKATCKKDSEEASTIASSPDRLLDKVVTFRKVSSLSLPTTSSKPVDTPRHWCYLARREQQRPNWSFISIYRSRLDREGRSSRRSFGQIVKGLKIASFSPASRVRRTFFDQVCERALQQKYSNGLL